MSKDKVRELKNAAAVEPAPAPVVDVVPVAPPVVAPAVQEKMQEADRMALELAKSRRETALAQAKEALAKNETADLAYKYVVLQLYMKYGLTAEDAISEGGDIVRGGAVAPAQGR
jgi:enoyl-CoA hydratase/carnithine racemase